MTTTHRTYEQVIESVEDEIELPEFRPAPRGDYNPGTWQDAVFGSKKPASDRQPERDVWTIKRIDSLKFVAGSTFAMESPTKDTVNVLKRALKRRQKVKKKVLPKVNANGDRIFYINKSMLDNPIASSNFAKAVLIHRIHKDVSFEVYFNKTTHGMKRPKLYMFLKDVIEEAERCNVQIQIKTATPDVLKSITSLFPNVQKQEDETTRDNNKPASSANPATVR